MTSKQLLIYFAREWSTKYGKSYLITWGRESKAAARITRDLDEETAKRAVHFYLYSLTNNFVISRGHPFGLLPGSLNECVAGLVREEKLAAATTEHPDFERLERAKHEKP